MLVILFMLLWLAGSVLVMGLMQGFWILGGRKGEGPVKPGCFWVIFVPVASLAFLMLFAWFTSPVKPTRDEITGWYEIDQSFHPGVQADWQHETYTMEITGDEVIVRDARTTKEWRHAIAWFSGPEYRWRFDSLEEKHHMVRGGAAIIRENFGYYYVFESPLYGEVVFRKKAGFPWWLVWSVAGIGALVCGRRLWKMGTLERALP